MMDRQAQQALLDELAHTHQLLAEIPEATALTARANRLMDRIRAQEKLVAVFGAFSAGKSSLINALTGEAQLAVSPNPTTATVSRLAYAGDGQPRAVIHAKTPDQLFEDVSAAFATLQIQVKDLADASERAKALKMAGWSPRQRRSVSFLRAFADGYEEMATRLGETFTAALDELSPYTAHERIACFIDSVDVLQTRSLFEQGLSLVDTPGVDSIHRRHTDVAFRYMQEADAILFVLYYTHAFSRADKDFVLQLSGVQDVAKEDKLFVVLNAVDLASSPEELAAVKERITMELRQAGIVRPRIYAISSQLGYAAKQLAEGSASPEVAAMVRQRLGLDQDAPLPTAAELAATAGLTHLEDELLQYTEERFSELLSASAARFFADVKRHADERMDRFAIRLEQSEEDGARLAAERSELQARFAERVEAARSGDLTAADALAADWNELLFHAGERIRIRFGGLVREAFHPGRFRNEAKSKESLKDAAAELTTSLERQIEVELRTLQLRMQKGMAESLEVLENDCQTALQQVHVPAPGLSFSVPEDFTLDTLHAHLNGTDIERTAEKHFRSPKQFFEGGGQSAFTAAAEGICLQAIRAELTALADVQQKRVLTALQRSAEAGWTQAVALIRISNQEGDLTSATLEILQTKWARIRTAISQSFAFHVS